MSYKYNHKLITLLSILMLISSGCGGSTSQSQDQISTAVAQTVQAQDSLTAVANLPIPSPLAEISKTAEAIATNTNAPVSEAPGCTVSASLISETPPDEAILRPGELFWKTWTIKNTGTCTWDRTYQFVFWSGDLMDGLTAYTLPDVFAPEEQKEISIYLKAPVTEGSFTGYWKIQAPWGASFGVGQYDEPIYVEVVVSDDRRPNYQVTSVDFSVVRNPESGCPANVYYTLNAAITTSGPLDVKYHWNASGSLFTQPRIVTFDSAQTKTISYTLGVNKNDNKPTDYWILFSIDEPTGFNLRRVYLNHSC